MKMTAHTAQLGELVTIVGGGTPSRDRPEYYNGGIPWMTVKDFNDDFFIRNPQEHISALGVENSATRVIPAGNVILGTRMSVGKAAINLVDLAINQDLKALLCGSELDPRYLTFFLAAASPRLEAQASGATVKGITIDDVEALEVPLPSVPEQVRIGRQLEQADRLRRTRRYALELSDTFLPAAFLELFGDPVLNPLKWESALLEDVCADGNGIKAGPFGSSLKKDFYSKTGIRIYGQEQVIGGDFRIGNYYISEEMFSDFTAYEVLPGDLLISLVGSFGKVIVVPDGIERGIINPRLLKISPKPERVESVFVAKLIEHPLVQRQLVRMSHGGTMGILNASLLRSLQVIVPPLALQQKFVLLVERHERLRTTQREALRQAEHLFQTLLHQAFNEPS